MTSETDFAVAELSRFVRGSVGALLQLLVAAATKNTFGRIINCPTYPVPSRTADLPGAVTLLQQALARSTNAAGLLADIYTSACPLAHRKRMGQFFTDSRVADWAITVSRLGKMDSVCDAGAGTAVFAEALIKAGLDIRLYTGIENDPVLALCASHVLEAIDAPPSFKIWYTNFLTLRRRAFEVNGLKPPTVIISNPPYVRFHNLHGRDRILAGLSASLRITLSPFSGVGNYFLCRGADLVRENSSDDSIDISNPRLLFFFPSEASGAAHSRQLRDDLKRIHGWRWDEYFVPRDRMEKQQSDALALFFAFERTGVRTSTHRRISQRGYVVGDALEIKRGISTGCNDFFVLTDAEAQERKIPRRRLLPVLPTRIGTKNQEFSSADWDALRLSHHPCWLLYLPTVNIQDLEPPVQAYLKEGIQRGLHSTPTAQRLKTWFSLPIPTRPPDIFVTYFFRGAPRFVINTAHVFHLTNILGGWFRHSALTAPIRHQLVDVLNATAVEWIDEHAAGREYRGGLRKIEPKELQKLPLPASVANLIRREADPKELSLALFD